MREVELRDVAKAFGPLVAVNNVSFHVTDGEFLTLLGPSGCGKTTTLRMIAGLETPDNGTIRIGERVVFDQDQLLNVAPEKRNLGMVFQSYAIWPHMTVFQNVAYPLRWRKKQSQRDMSERVRSVLELVGLQGFENRPATKLSGGQQQRVALARAVAFEPDVLLLDEPLSNLDAKLRDYMRFELRAMQKRLGTTAIYVTHDQEEALTLSDRLIVMNGGSIEQIGTPLDVYLSPASRFVADFIGKTNFIPADSLKEDGRKENVCASLSTFNGAVTLRAPVDRVRASARLEPGSTTWSVRPEKITIEPAESDRQEAPDLNFIPGRVSARGFLGDRIEYLVAVSADVSVRVTTPPAQDWPMNMAVRLVFSSSDALIFH